MKKWLPTIGIVLGAGLTALTPQLSQLLSQHSEAYAAVVWLAAFLAHLAPSPLQK